MAGGETIRISQLKANHLGGRYEGEVSIATGQREGHGKYLYPNPYFTYEGQWHAGQKHGRGLLSFADGGYYEGSFEHGEITGEGTQKWADGSTYVGQFVEGAKHGQGVHEKHDRTRYTGSWAHNKYSGEGELALPSGDTYSGGFRLHRYHGRGRLVQPSAGRSYSGAFESGLFEGEGELQERGGAFEYAGQFHLGKKEGHGVGTDTLAGVTHDGDWLQDLPRPRAALWDLCVPGTQDSYVPAAEQLKTEAANQVNSVGVDSKKDKGKKAEPKKFTSEPPPEDAPQPGPELKLYAGQPMPEVALRAAAADKACVTAESGRRLQVKMYKERKVPSKEDPGEVEIMRRPVRFGDRRSTYTDPLDESPSPSGKASPVPPQEGTESEEEPPIGDEVREDLTGPGGELTIGGGEEWFIPAHLQPAIYWLSVEDITAFEPGSPWERLSTLEVPVRVIASPDGK